MNKKYRIIETYNGFKVQVRKTLFGILSWWGFNRYWKNRIYATFNDAKTSIVKNGIDFKPLKFTKPYGPKYNINEVVTFYNSKVNGDRTNEIITGRIIKITVKSNEGHVSYEYCMKESEHGHVYVEIPEKYII